VRVALARTAAILRPVCETEESRSCRSAAITLAEVLPQDESGRLLNTELTPQHAS